jgi:flagellar biosynthesis/type III secretory pathway protein FliH
MTAKKNLIKGQVLQTSQVFRPSLRPNFPASVEALSKAARTTDALHSAVTTRTSPSVDAAELEQIKEKARQEGLALGRQQAKAELEKALRDNHTVVEGLVKSVSAAIEAHWARMDKLLPDFAFIAVNRVLGDALQSPEAVLASVRAALHACDPWEDVTLEVHPRDLELVSSALGAEALQAQKTLRFTASNAVKVGGCRVVSEEGVLDARLEVQLKQLRDSLDAARAA